MSKLQRMSIRITPEQAQWIARTAKQRSSTPAETARHVIGWQMDEELELAVCSVARQQLHDAATDWEAYLLETMATMAIKAHDGSTYPDGSQDAELVAYAEGAVIVVSVLKGHDGRNVRYNTAVGSLDAITVPDPDGSCWQDYVKALLLQVIGQEDIRTRVTAALAALGYVEDYLAPDPADFVDPELDDPFLPVPDHDAVNAHGIAFWRWIHTQRTAYAEGELAPDLIVELEAIPGWTWDRPR